MTSKVEQITETIRGSGYFSQNGLSDYHAARLARDANRCGTTLARLSAIRRALKKHNVAIDHDGMGNIIMRNRVTGARYVAFA